MPDTGNTLYYGNNLPVMRLHIGDETVDLVYLDPPFNSNAAYNVLFREKDGSQSRAQSYAFEDTWHWGAEAAECYEDVVEGGGKPSDAMRAFRRLLGENDMMAYLAMMAPRLVELHRVLKPTGSMYLHCDPTASHYLKLLVDAIFDVRNFRNEIIWKRTSGHSDAKRCGNTHDVILAYAKSDQAIWNKQYQAYDEGYVEQYYRYVDDQGRHFKSGDLSAYGLQGGGYEYEWNGHAKLWRCPQTTMQSLHDEGKLFYTRNGVARLKQYLDDAAGMPLQDVWSDLQPLRSWHRERLGYPTQKPESLLERIIAMSSNEGDLVLDPFCGCGTTVSVAQRLNRRWIGIDITHAAMTLMKYRLATAFGDRVSYQIIGEPVSVPDAQALAEQDPYQFQWWALGLVGARPHEKKKGADRGIDGRLLFHDEPMGGETKEIILSVKSGHVTALAVRDLGHVVGREGAVIGVLITMQEPTGPMKTEAAAAGFYTHRLTGKRYPKLQILTVEDLLSRKLIDRPYATSPTATFKAAPAARGKQARQDVMELPE